jgi:hypothetical protein
VTSGGLSGKGSRADAACGLVEGSIQGLKERHALCEQRVIVGVHELKPFDDRTDRRGLRGAKTTVL